MTAASGLCAIAICAGSSTARWHPASATKTNPSSNAQRKSKTRPAAVFNIFGTRLVDQPANVALLARVCKCRSERRSLAHIARTAAAGGVAARLSLAHRDRADSPRSSMGRAKHRPTDGAREPRRRSPFRQSKRAHGPSTVDFLLPIGDWLMVNTLTV